MTINNPSTCLYAPHRGQPIGSKNYSYQAIEAGLQSQLTAVENTVAFTDTQSLCAYLKANPQMTNVLCFCGLDQLPSLPKHARIIPVLKGEFNADSKPSLYTGDWPNILQHTAAAIAVDDHTATAVKRRMPADFPLLNLKLDYPAYIPPEKKWFERFKRQQESTPVLAHFVVDSRELDLAQQWRSDRDISDLAAAKASTRVQRGEYLTLDGTVFTTIVNPGVCGESWIELLLGFGVAMRERQDATLIIKMNHPDAHGFYPEFIGTLSRLSPFQCRIIAIHGDYQEEHMRDLVKLSDYYIHARAESAYCHSAMTFAHNQVPLLALSGHVAQHHYPVDEQLLMTSSTTRNVDGSAQNIAWLPYKQRLQYPSLKQALAHALVVKADQQRYRALQKFTAEQCPSASERHALRNWLQQVSN